MSKFILLWQAMFLLVTIHAQTPFAEVATKTFDVKYADPEQIRALFAGRSFVMEANRELRTLTAHGTPAFLHEVEDAVKRFDIAPPAPTNLDITLYLLTTATQAPNGGALPNELIALGKQLSAEGAQGLRLADSQMIRLREGQSGETAGATSSDSALLSRIRLKSATTFQAGKGEMVSLNGLQVWLAVQAAAITTGSPPTKTDADVSADLDVEVNQPVVVSKAGVTKPVVVVVRASVAH